MVIDLFMMCFIFLFVVWILSQRRTGMTSKPHQCLILATLEKPLLRERSEQVCYDLYAYLLY